MKGSAEIKRCIAYVLNNAIKYEQASEDGGEYEAGMPDIRSPFEAPEVCNWVIQVGREISPTSTLTVLSAIVHLVKRVESVKLLLDAHCFDMMAYILTSSMGHDPRVLD
ncbi:unnamed protein product, partial [Chrysoparadoxa australica]